MAEPSATLRDPAHRVSPRAPYLWLLGASFRSLFVAGVGVLAVLAWGASIPTWAWIAYVVAAVAYTLVMPQFRYRVHRWETTETAVYTQRGWLSRERRIAPMSRVQTVDFQQTVVARLFGLASVTVTTASAAGPLQIEDLDADVAQRLVDDLTRRAEADRGDAT
ncbi:membrane protein YdbS with pleckstrin-like domain [Marmoricola sp. OAE513]|uniref:PH domain-containing protein n=1 Tax=Marmoricola sp. OAE513 TaxID=2817894 RepID=UPI001AE35D23